MKFKKEIILVVSISIIIIVLEIVTNWITENSVQKIYEEISEINNRLKILNEISVEDSNYEKQKNELNEKIKIMKDNWFLEQNKLAYFSEHNELEKVSKCLITLEENMKNEEYTIALEDGVEFIYWLNHIKEKDKLEIKNIF